MLKPLRPTWQPRGNRMKPPKTS